MDKDYVSLTQFENNPALKKEFGGDYQAYLRTYVQQMQQTPLFKLASTTSFKNLPNSIKDSIWRRSKQADQKADTSKETYSIAVKAEQSAIKARKAAEKYLEKMTLQYDEGDSHITDAQKKLTELMKGSSNATLARELAGDRMVSDSKASLRAFQNGMIADALINRG